VCMDMIVANFYVCVRVSTAYTSMYVYIHTQVGHDSV